MMDLKCYGVLESTGGYEYGSFPMPGGEDIFCQGIYLTSIHGRKLSTPQLVSMASTGKSENTSQEIQLLRIAELAFLNDRGLEMAETMAIEHPGNYHINTIAKDWSGMYKCILSNIYKKENSFAIKIEIYDGIEVNVFYDETVG